MKILKFKGVYKDYIWGGNKMCKKFGVKTDVSPVAESWVLSGHLDGMSVIDGGESDGVTLEKFIAENPQVLGTNCPSKELPILIKFIDAAENLSVQVHPCDELAKKWENQNGKTEMWYVAGADKGAKIIHGIKESTSKKELAEAIKNNTVESLLGCVDSKKGDVFFVEAGTIHAICKGNLIAEIQQNSNVTYRLYDYGRVGKDGKPRELHIEKGVESANTEKSQERAIPTCSDGTKMIGSCKFFQVKEVKLTVKEKRLCSDEKSYHALVQTEGESLIKYTGGEALLSAGQVAFIPAGEGEYSLSGKGTVLLVQNPPRYFVALTLVAQILRRRLLTNTEQFRAEQKEKPLSRDLTTKFLTIWQSAQKRRQRQAELILKT